MPQERSAGAIVYRMVRGKPIYLVLHYEAGHWDFVKGKIEKGEEKLGTVKREALEEAGLDDLSFIDGFEENLEYFYRREGRTIHKEVTFFLAETGNESVELSHEHVDSEWLGYEEARDKLTFDNAKAILDKANGFLVRK